MALLAIAVVVAIAPDASADAGLLAKWGSAGNGPSQFRIPTKLTVDPAGNVYVADSNNYRVQKFTTDGVFISQWGSIGTANGQFEVDQAVASDTAGNIYVADFSNHRIQKFTGDGTFITAWGSQGTGNGQFQSPNGVAVSPAGDVFTIEFAGGRVQRFTSDGTFVTTWGGFGSAPGQFQRPYGIAADAAGNVYVADRDASAIDKFAADGTFIKSWGSRGAGDGQFAGEEDLAVAPDGTIVVADTTNYRVQRFTSDGTFISKFDKAGSETFQPHGITVNQAGDIYINDGQANIGPRILKVHEVPAPVLGKSVDAQTIAGTVLIKLPGAKKFVKLTAQTQIAVGSSVDTTRGTVRITAARDTKGATEQGDFRTGVFKVTQRATSTPVTDLALQGGNFKKLCGGRATAAASAGRKVRHLWSKSTGHFRTTGRFASASVRGTEWEMQDRCDGTLTRVKSGAVTVRDVVRKKTVIVTAGKSYLARAKR